MEGFWSWPLWVSRTLSCSCCNFKLINVTSYTSSVSLASRGCERDPTGVVLGSPCPEQEKRCSTVSRANSLPATIVTPARNTTSQQARLPLLHLLKLHYKFLKYYYWYRIEKRSASCHRPWRTSVSFFYVLVMSRSEASLAPFVCVRHLFSV